MFGSTRYGESEKDFFGKEGLKKTLVKMKVVYLNLLGSGGFSR